MTGVEKHWRAMLGRLEAGESLRLLIGDTFYDASEIVMLPAFSLHLRETLTADITARLAELSPPPSAPASPAMAVAVPAEAAL